MYSAGRGTIGTNTHNNIICIADSCVSEPVDSKSGIKKKISYRVQATFQSGQKKSPFIYIYIYIYIYGFKKEIRGL